MAVSRAARALFLSLLLSACQVTKPMIKVGLAAPFEGLYRNVGQEALYAVKLAIAESNQRGGVGGYMVELVALDDSGESARAVEQAREMALDPKIMGVVGHLRAETTSAALPIYHQEGLALLVPPVALQPTSFAEVFWLGAPRSVLEDEALDYVVDEMGVQRVAVLSEDWDHELQDSYPLERYSDLHDLCASTSVDFLLFRGGDWEAAETLEYLRGEGLGTRLLGGENLDSAHLVSWAGQSAEGTVYASSTATAADPAFKEGYRALAGTDPGPHASMAYDAARTLLLALEKSIEADGKPSRAGVIRALGGISYDGLTGPVSFDGQGYREVPPIGVYAIEGGYPGRILR